MLYLNRVFNLALKRLGLLNLYRMLYLNPALKSFLSSFLRIEPIQNVVFKYRELCPIKSYKFILNLYRMLYLNVVVRYLPANAKTIEPISFL